MYILVTAAIVAIQYTIMAYGGLIFRTVMPTNTQWIMTLLFAVSTLGFAALIKLTPEQWLVKIPYRLEDTNIKIGGINRIMETMKVDKGSEVRVIHDDSFLFTSME